MIPSAAVCGVGDNLVDRLDRPIRDTRRIEPRRPYRDRLGREEV